MSVELGGSIIARSDEAVILFERARYPVAYFPIGDIGQGVLQPSDHESTHPDLGKTKMVQRRRRRRRNDATRRLGARGPAGTGDGIARHRRVRMARDGRLLVGRKTFVRAEREASHLFEGARYQHQGRVGVCEDPIVLSNNMTIDGEMLEPARGQNVMSHGPDRNLSVDEIGGIQLVEDAAAAET
jgi:hypothetical protein